MTSTGPLILLLISGLGVCPDCTPLRSSFPPLVLTRVQAHDGLSPNSLRGKVDTT